MVIPTPSRPKLDEMPRDFFKELAVYSILKKREIPQSKLLPVPTLCTCAPCASGCAPCPSAPAMAAPPKPPPVVVLEAGVVGSLDYKIISAEDAEQLFQWLKDNQYSYSGDEATLRFYIDKHWLFTVMKIDTKQMKRNADGSFTGEVTPTRFRFPSDRLVYPLRITQLSVKDQTEALFYVQAPYKTDLKDDFSYEYSWIAMLEAASGCTPGGLPGHGGDWLKVVHDQIPELQKKSQQLGFQFVSGQRAQPNSQGQTPCTLEWARKLTADDINMLRGMAPYCEQVPDVDAGFTAADCQDPNKAERIYKVIHARLDKCNKDRPNGYLVREAPKEDVRQLRLLLGHLKEGQFVTKFRKVFTKGEMEDDLEIVPATVGQAVDKSEYEELLPSSPP
jgi:hypothetical protein